MGSTYTIEPPDTPSSSGFSIEPPAAQSAQAVEPARGVTPLTPLGSDAKPIQMSGTPPLQQAWNDVKAGNYAQAAHGLITAGGKALSPLAVPAIAAAPAAAAGAAALGTAGQYGAQKVAQKMGATPAQASLAGDAGALALGAVGAKVGPAISNAVENTLPEAKMAQAGQVFKELKGNIGEHTVQMTDKLADALADVKEAVDTGSTLPSVINKFVTRISDTDQPPLTYSEARQFYHNVSELSASERMASRPSDLRVINNFKHALGDSISSTAESAGMLGQYQQAMKGYANAAQAQEAFQSAKSIAMKRIIAPLLWGAVAGSGGTGAYYLAKDLFGIGK